jgi:hypothetical protein
MSSDPNAPAATVSAHNISFVGHCGMDGRGDGVQVMVHRGHAFVGHSFNEGITIIDCRDPARPKVVNFLDCPPNTRSLHLQIHGDLLIAVNGPSVWSMEQFQDPANYFSGSLAEKLAATGIEFAAGLRMYDVSNPAAPREVGFMPTGGFGPHRVWYDGGKYAYASIHMDGYTDHIFTAIDMSDPHKPEIIGKWAIEGMWEAGGETPCWDSGRRYGLHHALVADGYAFGAWRDGGMTVLDVGDPSQPKLVAHRNWTSPFGGGTHSCLPLMDRNLLVVADEPHTSNCADGLRYVWVFDIRDKSNPISIATMPQPSEEDYCAKGGSFGPHNLHENRIGSLQSSELVFATYHNAGVRAYDIGNPFQPKEVGHYVPPDPAALVDPRPNRPRVVQSTDIYVDPNGLMFLTDKNAGLNILQFEGL